MKYDYWTTLDENTIIHRFSHKVVIVFNLDDPHIAIYKTTGEHFEAVKFIDLKGGSISASKYKELLTEAVELAEKLKEA